MARNLEEERKKKESKFFKKSKNPKDTLSLSIYKSFTSGFLLKIYLTFCPDKIHFWSSQTMYPKKSRAAMCSVFQGKLTNKTAFGWANYCSSPEMKANKKIMAIKTFILVRDFFAVPWHWNWILRDKVKYGPMPEVYFGSIEWHPTHWRYIVNLSNGVSFEFMLIGAPRLPILFILATLAFDLFIWKLTDLLTTLLVLVVALPMLLFASEVE